MTYSGSTGDYNLLLRWSTDKCVPLVRELTFENAEVTFYYRHNSLASQFYALNCVLVIVAICHQEIDYSSCCETERS